MHAGWVGAAVVAVAGCVPADDRPQVPVPTDGPNQVVIFVPAMT